MTGLWAEGAPREPVWPWWSRTPSSGTEVQPSGEPPLAALPEDAAGREGSGPSASRFRAPRPSPSTRPAGAHSCRPCSCGGLARPVGRAWDWGRRVPGRRGGGTAGPHLARAQRDQMGQKATFHPARGVATLVSPHHGEPERFRGTNPSWWAGTRGNWVGSRGGGGGNLVQVLSRWTLPCLSAAQVAKLLLGTSHGCRDRALRSTRAPSRLLVLHHPLGRRPGLGRSARREIRTFLAGLLSPRSLSQNPGHRA